MFYNIDWGHFPTHSCKNNLYRHTLGSLWRFYPQPFSLPRVSLHLPKLWLWLIHSGVTHLLVSQCFERATPFTTVTPSTFSPVMAEQRCVGWRALWKRDCGRTQVRINETHTIKQVTNQTSSTLHHHGDLIHILCAIMAWKRKLCPRAVDGIVVSE